MLWDDEPPAELRRRMQGDVSPDGRVRRRAPGMPLRFDDTDSDGVLRPAAERFRPLRAPWWRPASTTGRSLLAASVLLVLGSLTTVSILFARYIERDGRFRIAGSSNIQAAGLKEVSRGDLLPVFGEDIGRNVFYVPLSERRRELEQIPWIEHATVMRVLPDEIRVSIVERKPVAFTRNGQQIGLVDANGVLLSMSPKTMAERHYSFPVLTGLDPGDSAGSRKARMAVYLRLMADLDAGGKRNSEDISEIDLTDPEDARVLIPEQGTDILAHFGENHFLDRYQRYKAHIAEWRQQYPHLKSVDLRYDNQVVLQMASGAETANAAGAGPAAPAARTKLDARKPGAPAAKSKIKRHTATKRKLAETVRREAPRRAAEHRDKQSGHTAKSIEGE